MSGIADFDSEEPESLTLKLMNTEYTESGSRPITHLFGRDGSGEWHHIEVDGHRPSFFIRDEEHNDRIDNHYAVHDTEKWESFEDGERYTNLHGEPLVRVYTETPGQVKEMRDLFTETYEADVFYDKRWKIDNEVFTGIEIDLSDATDESFVTGDYRVDIDAVEPLSRDATPGVEPKKMVFDIEVASEEGMADTNKAEWPVSTIVAWDNYSEQYVGWVLCHDGWDFDGQDVPEEFRDADAMADNDLPNRIRTFDDESEMLHDFNEYIEHQRPDIITGWYSNDFDIPYLVNRCRETNTWNYQDWSPLGEVFIGKFEPAAKGISLVDMLGAYQKTQIHKLQSKKLDDIAAKECGHEKVDLGELDHTEMWKQKPVEFLRYNKVDVELVHRIDDEVGATDLLDNLRTVVGCDFSAPIGGNIDMMDMLFLRKAREYGYALPTAVKPDVGNFHGAYVYTPESGLHKNVVYPDYSSLYPNMMYQCNISPETLVGTADDLEASEYTEDDCVWSYIDTTTPPSSKSDVEANEDDMEKVYFLDPSEKEGFIRSVLDDVMGLAAQYSGGMYAAVKRVRNSTYGVMGDSDSYGSGFRLFDWRLAEATTLGGQRVLKEGGEVFTDAVSDPDARVIYGDTDSVVTTFPNADGVDEALDQSMDAVDDVNETINEFAVEQFGLDSVDDARMELEIESAADGIFFKGKDNGRSEEGVKKRYVQRIVWNDNDLWLDEPELEIKGFEYVRSDVANVTQDVQKQTFEYLLNMPLDEAEDAVKEYISGVVTDAMSGELSDSMLGIPFGISQSLDKYGSHERRPQPCYRGAKYANNVIYQERAITSGDKPLYYYVQEGYTGDYRKTYTAKTAEDGDYVDAISVLDANDIPQGFRIDRRKMVEKTIFNPMEAIFNTLGWGTSWVERAMDEATAPEYYREEGQTGLDTADFM